MVTGIPATSRTGHPAPAGAWPALPL